MEIELDNGDVSIDVPTTLKNGRVVLRICIVTILKHFI